MPLGYFLPAKFPHSLMGKFSRSLGGFWAQESLFNPYCASKAACAVVLLLLVWLAAFGSRGSHSSFSLSQLWVGAHLQLFQICQGFALTISALEGAAAQGPA